VQIIIRILRNLNCLIINFKVKLIINTMLVFVIILYISEARIFRVILLFFVEF
jgi:hypothetical protein